MTDIKRSVRKAQFKDLNGERSEREVTENQEFDSWMPMVEHINQGTWKSLENRCGVILQTAAQWVYRYWESYQTIQECERKD